MVSSQATTGPWFQAKLKRTRATIPVTEPPTSTRFQTLELSDSGVLGAGVAGIAKKPKTASKRHAKHRTQYDQGHQSL